MRATARGTTDLSTRACVDVASRLARQGAGGRIRSELNLNVRSDKNESATLTDAIVSIETSDGNVYKADSDGTIAAIGDGDDPLWFEDIGPDASVSSKVVFDLPSSALHKKLSVRFNELGFGSNHGYSALPTL